MSQKPLIVVVGETILDIDAVLKPVSSMDGFTVYNHDSGIRSRIGYGGAAAVAAMVKGLGGDVRLLTQYDSSRGAPVGANSDWAWDGGISEKRRYISGGKVLMRLDTTCTVSRVPAYVVDLIANECDGRSVYLILSDYGKGLFDAPGIAQALRSRLNPIESFGDPHRSRSSMVEASRLFGRCTVLAQGTQDPFWHSRLSDRVLEKRGKHGMQLHGEFGGYDSSPQDFGMDPTTAVDPCGCGDMAIAALAVARSEGMGWHDSLRFATAAAAEEALVWGAVPVSRSVVDARLKRG